ncbi:hypothetical protein GCM10023085_59390 [Actinomadura viridis]|uniref:TNT domain-containing protein n=1 Tax=Actinomadura viridis TaxID=58110 RepID=A0A931DSS1_9ACTN|nr:glycohydrolase toxin TNT-related protein [Actinomadura viridis]MBG6093267.1 hypothetical protein [Actinomadura viridis]
MTLTNEEIRERLDEIAEVVEGLLPPRWRDARLDYHALGSFESGELTCHGFWPGPALPRSGVFELLRDLRRDFYGPENGTWMTLRLHLDADEGWGVETDLLEDFRWKAEATAADCARELAEFPRPWSLVPGWMARLANAQRDADAFDPETILRRPRPEGALLGEGNEDYFERARATLADFMPAGLERLRIGRLEEGCWSVAPAGYSWVAVRYSGGRCDPVVAFPDARAALVHAAARIMAEAGMSIDSALLRAAGVLEKRHVAGADAWILGEAGNEMSRLTAHSPRPREGEAGAEPALALAALSGRPGEYFVCRPGPPPEEDYITARKVFELALARELPSIRRWGRGGSLSVIRDPGRVVTGPVESIVEVGLPQPERDLVPELAPESPLMFAWARRALRDVVGDRAEDFLVGRVAPGCWSVVRGEQGWLVVGPGGDGSEGGGGAEIVAFETALPAVADAMAGVMAASRLALTSGLLELAGLAATDRSGGRFWKPGSVARKIEEAGGGRGGPRSGGPGLALNGIEKRELGYFVFLPEPPPDDGPFVAVHEIYAYAAAAMLPEPPRRDAGSPDEGGVDLPAGTVLDGYGGHDQVFLFTPQTPFHRRGHLGGLGAYEHHTYRVQRPIRVYQGLPVAGGPLPAPKGDAENTERGYYLVDSIAELLKSGVLAEISGDGR